MNPAFRILPVRENKEFGSYHKITVQDNWMHKYARCGNFIMVGLRGLDPYLPRPFSFLDIDKKSFSFLLKVKGKGTELLAKKKEGDKLKILGPLGETFCPPEEGILIAGGIGIAPVYYQAGWMKGGVLLYGAKRKKDLILTGEFEKKGFKVITITEENGGFVTDLVRKFKEKLNDRQLFICGPNEMIKEIRNILSKEQLERAFAYMERRMGCGLGGCKSCAVETLDGYKLVCTEGPVFPLKEIKFD